MVNIPEHKPEKPKVYDLLEISEELEPDIIAKMAQEEIPGLAIALIDERGVVWSKGFGHTDLSKEIPVSSDTLFSLQSIGKTYTATAVLLAVQQGKLELDDPLKKHYPGFSVNSRYGDEEAEKITFRHLLSHRAAFTHESPLGNNYDDGDCSFDEHIERISETWLKFPVGSKYSYSNLGFDLAAYVLQLLSGKPFEETIEAMLLEPLGMHRSVFGTQNARRKGEMAIGHWGKIPDHRNIMMLGAGGLYSTVNDMAKYVAFQINKGLAGGEQLLRQDLLDEMAKIQFPHEEQVTGMGLGLAVNHYLYKDLTLLSHGGGGYGYISYQGWMPELKIGVAILSNQANAGSVQELLPTKALAVLSKAKHGYVLKQTLSQHASLEQVAVTPEKLKRLEGIYHFRGNSLNIKLVDDDLVLKMRPLGISKNTLKPHSEDIFSLDTTLFQFVIGLEDRPESISAKFANGTQVEFDFDHSPNDPPGKPKEQWQQYAGMYRIMHYFLPTYSMVWLENGNLFFEIYGTKYHLEGYERGLFFTVNGEAVKFTKDTMIFASIPFVKEELNIELLKQKFETDPDDFLLTPRSIKSIVNSFYLCHRKQEAARILQILIEKSSADAEVYFMLATIFFELSKHERARQVCEEGLAKFSETQELVELKQRASQE